MIFIKVILTENSHEYKLYKTFSKRVSVKDLRFLEKEISHIKTNNLGRYVSISAIKGGMNTLKYHSLYLKPEDSSNLDNMSVTMVEKTIKEKKNSIALVLQREEFGEGKTIYKGETKVGDLQGVFRNLEVSSIINLQRRANEMDMRDKALIRFYNFNKSEKYRPYVFEYLNEEQSKDIENKLGWRTFTRHDILQACAIFEKEMFKYSLPDPIKEAEEMHKHGMVSPTREGLNKNMENIDLIVKEIKEISDDKEFIIYHRLDDYMKKEFYTRGVPEARDYSRVATTKERMVQLFKQMNIPYEEDIGDNGDDGGSNELVWN